MRITCRVYPWSEANPSWPEATMWPGYHQRDDVGIAFSGGGTRSACLTLGTLRALTHAGLIDRARYVSAASGGAWCAVPWTFLPATASERDFLGESLQPEMLTPARIDQPEHSFLFRTNDAPLAQLYAQYAGLGDERFGRVIGHVFLRPDGHDHPDRLFTLDAAHAKRLAPANPGVQFTRVTRDRPFLLVGGAMLLANPIHDFDWVPFDMTPLYVGVAREHIRIRDKRKFGGGFVDACGFDSAHRAGAGSVRRCHLGNYRFTLNDMVGITGAAPSAIAALLNVSNGISGLPRLHTWCISGRDGVERENSDELRIGDGGLYEHNGVLMQVMRGIRRIVSFVNTSDAPDTCVDLARLFGKLLPLDPVNPVRQGMQIFPTSDWQPLVDELKRDGVALREHQLVRCAHAGFRPRPNERATILWVYNPSLDIVQRSDWFKRLPTTTKPLFAQRSDLKPFPRVPTFYPQPDRGLNPDYFIELSYAQSRLLSSWADWRASSPESEGGILELLCAMFNVPVSTAAANLAAARLIVN